MNSSSFSCLTLSISFSISQSLSQFTYTHQTQKNASILTFGLFLFYFLIGKYRNGSHAFLYFTLFVCCWFSFYCAAAHSLSLSWINVCTRFQIFFLTDFWVVCARFFLFYLFFFDKSAVFEKCDLFFSSFYSVGRVKLCVSSRLISEWYFSVFFLCGIIVSMKYCCRHEVTDKCVLYYLIDILLRKGTFMAHVWM